MAINPLLLDLPMPIITPRLKIVPWHPMHSDLFYEAQMQSRPNMIPWMTWAENLPTPDTAKEVLIRGHAKFILRETLNMLAFTHDGQLAVSTGLHDLNWEVPSCAIGYWCNTPFTGQGYVTEAANALARYAFSAMKMRRVAIAMDKENTKSIAVAERLNMVKEFEQLGGIMTLHRDGVLRTRVEYACFDTSNLPPLDVKW